MAPWRCGALFVVGGGNAPYMRVFNIYVFAACVQLGEDRHSAL